MTEFSFRVRDNIQSFVRRWDSKVKSFAAKGAVSVKETAEAGASYAKTIAPKDTTTLIQAISWKTVGSKKAPRAFVWVRNSPLNPVREKTGGNLKHATPSWYAYHMNFSWPQKIRTGDPHFMRTTKRYAEKVLKRKIIADVGRFVK